MTEAGRSWYRTGYEAVDQEKDRQARGSGPQRFWMKAGTKREIVFLDDEPLNVYEHSYRQDGHWNNHITCLKDSSDYVPCCEKLGFKSRSFVGFYTIVDLTDIKDSKGKSYQYEVKLLPAKTDTLTLIKRKKESKTSLVGMKFNVSRDTTDHAAVGNDYEPDKVVDLDKLFKVATYKGKLLSDFYKEALEKKEVMARLLDVFQVNKNPDGSLIPGLTPFNYFEILKPRDPREVKQILNGVDPDQGSKSTSSFSESPSRQDDDIPF